ncbi:MAG: hypothetical protein IH899_10645 [Planctomycetes bacterium]|nr:hypothetical protein [Planctomycetota bacterium]
MTTTSIPSNVEQFTERIQDWRTADVTVDRTMHVVRNVALTASKSKNGYHYSPEALREAVVLYENKPVFLDHASNLSRPFDRSTRDLVGSIINPRFEEGRIRADIQTLDTESGRTFIALAESDSPAVGMSHVVLAERGRDKSVVEKIHDVVSVDAVVFPATASTFRESLQQGSISAIPGSIEATLASIDQALPNHVRRVQGEEFFQVRRIGLYSDQVLIETERNDDASTELSVVDWSIQDGDVVLGEKLTPITSAAIRDGSWLAQKCEQEREAGNGKDSLSADQIDAFQADINQLTAERDELRRCVDRFEREHRESEKQREIEQLLEEAELPAEIVTDVFRKQLFWASDEAARQELISERRNLM